MTLSVKSFTPELCSPCPCRQKIETVEQEKASIQKMVEKLKKQVRKHFKFPSDLDSEISFFLKKKIEIYINKQIDEKNNILCVMVRLAGETHLMVALN